MPGDRKLKQTTLMLGSLADVVHNPGRRTAIRRRHHNRNVRQPARNRAGDKIPGR